MTGPAWTASSRVATTNREATTRRAGCEPPLERLVLLRYCSGVLSPRPQEHLCIVFTPDRSYSYSCVDR
jgi:hypothetical protein